MDLRAAHLVCLGRREPNHWTLHPLTQGRGNAIQKAPKCMAPHSGKSMSSGTGHELWVMFSPRASMDLIE